MFIGDVLSSTAYLDICLISHDHESDAYSRISRYELSLCCFSSSRMKLNFESTVFRYSTMNRIILFILFYLFYSMYYFFPKKSLLAFFHTYQHSSKCNISPKFNFFNLKHLRFILSLVYKSFPLSKLGFLLMIRTNILKKV